MIIAHSPDCTALEKLVRVCNCGAENAVAIPVAQHEALLALRPIVAELAYARAPLNDRVYREAREALAALRAAGIEGAGK